MEQSELDLRSLFGIIRRQSKIIVYVILGILILTVAYLFTVTPKYTATALVEIEPNREVLSDASNALNNTGAISAAVEGEAEILRSSDVLMALILDQGLIRDPEFGVQPPLLDQLRSIIGLEAVGGSADPQRTLVGVVNSVRDAVSVRRKGLTYLIEVSVTSEDADKAARLANALGEKYIEKQVAQKVNQTLVARNILQQRVREAAADLERVEGSVDVFLEDFVSEYVAQSDRQDLVTLRDELSVRDRQIARSEERIALLSSAVSGAAWDSLNADLLGETSQALLSERQRLNRQLITAQADGIDTQQLREELQRLEVELSEVAANELSSTRQRVSALNVERDGVRDELRVSVLNSDLAPGTLSELYQLQQESDIARSQYDDLLRRLRQLDTLSTLQIADASVVSQALAPNRASHPRKQLILALALVLSVGLGLGLAFLNEFFVGGFASDEQLRDGLGEADVFSVPAISDNPDDADVSRAVIDVPMSGFAESFRQLKKAVEKKSRAASDDLGGRVVIATSAIPAEGKSTSALGLARSLALGGAKTILVDFDLRKPSVSDKLGVEGSSALIEHLSGGVDFEELSNAFVDERESGLHVLVGGGRADVPTDSLLGSQAARKLVDRLRGEYDWVIIDSAPILPVVDTLYVSDLADVVLMLVRFASTNQRDVRRAHARLRSEMRDGAEVLPVLSMEQQRSGSYYYRGYYSGYGYVKRDY